VKGTVNVYTTGSALVGFGCIFLGLHCMTHGYMCFVYPDLYGSKTRNCSIILVSVSVVP
jgi:hypothetical protein